MIDKTVGSCDEALTEVFDGACIMIGGFGQAEMPDHLVDALIAKGARELTIVNNNAGNGESGLAALLKAGRVRKIICSFPRQADSHHFDRLYRAGQIELEVVPQGNLVARIQAADAGFGAFYTPTGYGTQLAEGKETRNISGRNYVPEHPISADFALIKAHRGDRWGIWFTTKLRETSRRSWPQRPNVQLPKSVPSFHWVRWTLRLSSHRAFSCNASSRRHPRWRGDDNTHGKAQPRANGSPGRPRHSRRRVRQPGDTVADHGREFPAGRQGNYSAQRKCYAGHWAAPAPEKGREDHDLINAGKQPVTLLTGGSYFHQADSFAMVRGGHLDICVLGGFQTSIHGDLANWHKDTPGAIPAVGGAMELAIGAKQVFVMMELLTKNGESKLVEQCTYPVTGLRCVSRVYTDLAIFDLTPHGVVVTEMVSGLHFGEIECLTRLPLRAAPSLVAQFRT